MRSNTVSEPKAGEYSVLNPSRKLPPDFRHRIVLLSNDCKGYNRYASKREPLPHNH